MAVREVDGVPVLEASLPRPFRALFTTRLGGESAAPFAGLNLSPFVGDDPEVVARNRGFVHGVGGAAAGEPQAGARPAGHGRR